MGCQIFYRISKNQLAAGLERFQEFSRWFTLFRLFELNLENLEEDRQRFFVEMIDTGSLTRGYFTSSCSSDVEIEYKMC